MDKPADILNSTTPQIRKLIEEMLKIEKDYQYLQNIKSDKLLEKEISDKIKKVLVSETSK